MKYLCGIPFVIIMISIIFSLREVLTEEEKKEKYLIPFCKIVKKLCKINFVKVRIKKHIMSVADQYSDVYTRKKAVETAQINTCKSFAKSLLVLMLGSILAVLFVFSNSNEATDFLLRRKTGEGPAKYEIEAEIQGEKRKIPIVLEEKQYTKEEVEKWFDYACENIDTLILGNNQSLDEVQEDLELIDRIPDTAIEVSWQCSDYTIIQPNGELNRENISKDGNKIKLIAVFSYMELERKHEIELIVKQKTYKGIERYFQMLKENIAREEKEERTGEVYNLPKEVEGKQVTYSKEDGHEEFIILFLAIILALLLPFKEKDAANKEKQKRSKKMLLEYPELVCKLSLYLGAGINISKAWEKIATDISANKGRIRKNSLLSEQVLYTYRQLQNGSLIIKAFEDFGNRCGLQSFKKLSLLINSNLKKGSADLALILDKEAKEAMEARKNTIMKTAAEASVKLMLPMMMELIVVIGILIVPAFLTLEV